MLFIPSPLFRACLFCEIGFHPFCEFPPGKHYTMAATLAFQANICAKTNHFPFIRAAGMRFTQTHEVVELEIGKHGIPQ